jgi:hypothetical protein
MPFGDAPHSSWCFFWVCVAHAQTVQQLEAQKEQLCHRILVALDKIDELSKLLASVFRVAFLPSLRLFLLPLLTCCLRDSGATGEAQEQEADGCDLQHPKRLVQDRTAHQESGWRSLACLAFDPSQS